MPRKTNIWNVAVDYRIHGNDCVLFATVRAQTELEAIDKAKVKLRRAKARTAPIIWGNARAEPSGWNR